MKEILYKSTRLDGKWVNASQAILSGLAENGGLYVPSEIPVLDMELSDLAEMNYQQVAFEVLSRFFTDYTAQELKYCIEHAYDAKFDTEEIAPLVKVGDAWYLELFHGPTIAFKDMALSILPYLMTTAAKKNHVTKEIVILTATSGDTGKAALAGFADVPGTRIIVFFPEDGVSAIQKKQMVTQKGDNTLVAGVKGNFDDCQNGVKAVFSDETLNKQMGEAGYQFSSANSINIGRLVPQIAYYVYAYARMLKSGSLKPGEDMNVVVPTGNFGNILSGYYAKKMGIPIKTLICASNENKVLYDFFNTGTYDKNRPFVLTSSPSMDILISSNLERLIYELTGSSTEETVKLMNSLRESGSYRITPSMRSALSGFFGGFATEQETAGTINRIFKDSGYVCDTHTAVAASVYESYKVETKDETKAVIVSTASPFKFVHSVMKALGSEDKQQDEFIMADELASLSGVAVPGAVEEIRSAPIRHKTVCEINDMTRVIKKFLNLL